MLELVKPYCDQATLEIIGKLLKANYVDISNLSNVIERSSKGTPQGSLLSPLLANIYLHELDVFVENELIPKWNIGDGRKYVSGYQNRKNLTKQQIELLDQIEIDGVHEVVRAYKHNQWVNDGFGARDQSDPNFKRLHYVRYVDDILLGFIGTRDEAKQIKTTITEFLSNKLNLTVNEAKSAIHHSSDKNILFLGYYIKYLPPKRTLDKSKKFEGINQAQLRIPVQTLLQRLVDKGFASKRKNETYRASSVRKYASFEDKLIVNRFSSVIRGLLNYYKPSNQYSDM